MVDRPIFNARIGRQYTECEQWRLGALAKIAELEPDIVIMGSAFGYGFKQSDWIEGTVSVLQSIGTKTGHIYVLRSTPILPFDGPSCLTPRSWLHTALTGDSRCTTPSDDPAAEDIFSWLKIATSHVPNASMLDITDAVCPGGQCRAKQGDTVVFRDSQHLSAEFAKSLAPVMAKRLNLRSDTDRKAQKSR